MADQREDRQPQITGFVCGGSDCPAGGEHDSKDWVEWDEGRSVSACCSKCGSTAMERDLMRLP